MLPDCGQATPGHLSQVVQHPRDARLAIVLAIDVVEDIADLLLCQALAVECAGKSLTLLFLIPQYCQYTRMEVAITIPWYPEGKGATLTIRVVYSIAVTLVAWKPVFTQILTPLCYHHTLNHYLHQVMETIFSFRMLA